MSDERKSAVGTIAWTDLTVPDADRLRDFYRDVVGWKVEECDMGEYSDYVMASPATGEGVAGVCHARGGNADMPAQWMVYLVVVDVEKSAERCREAGGKVIVGPKPMGKTRFCVIRDPAGAVCALIENE